MMQKLRIFFIYLASSLRGAKVIDFSGIKGRNCPSPVLLKSCFSIQFCSKLCKFTVHQPLKLKTRTMTLTAAEVSKKNSPLKTILFAGLTAGVLDILAAFISAYIVNGVTPDRVLRFVASGVFGREA